MSKCNCCDKEIQKGESYCIGQDMDIYCDYDCYFTYNPVSGDAIVNNMRKNNGIYVPYMPLVVLKSHREEAK